MRTDQSSEAKARLPEYLDDLERAEVIVITRHGKPVAHLVPTPGVDRERAGRRHHVCPCKKTPADFLRCELPGAGQAKASSDRHAGWGLNQGSGSRRRWVDRLEQHRVHIATNKMQPLHIGQDDKVEGLPRYPGATIG